MITWQPILPQRQAHEKNPERRAMSSPEYIPEDRAPDGAHPPSRLRQLAAASIGNTVEWFSYTVAQAAHLSVPYLHLRRSEQSCG